MDRRGGRNQPFISRRAASETLSTLLPTGENLPVPREPDHSREAAETPTKRKETLQQEVEQGLYIISVAARLLNMHPQTLRKYERFGLITPSRTIGMLRLYSEEDIARLRLIKHLVDDLSLNLAGVELALGMVNYLMTMKRYLEAPDEDELRNFMEQRLEEMFALLNTEFP